MILVTKKQLSPAQQARKNYLLKRMQAYQHVFNSENTFLADVFNDLSRFCRANDTTFHIDPRAHAALEGRREVWLRIKDHLDMNVDDLLIKLGGDRGE